MIIKHLLVSKLVYAQLNAKIHSLEGMHFQHKVSPCLELFTVKQYLKYLLHKVTNPDVACT